MGTRDLNAVMVLYHQLMPSCFLRVRFIVLDPVLHETGVIAAKKAMLTFLQKKQEERWEWSHFACGGLLLAWLDHVLVWGPITMDRGRMRYHDWPSV